MARFSGRQFTLWTAGGGVEWAFAPHWSARLEGLYFDLGTMNSLASSVPVGRTQFQEGYSFDIAGWIARAAVDFHF